MSEQMSLENLRKLSQKIATKLRSCADFGELDVVPEAPGFFYEQGEFGDYPIFAYPGKKCDQYAAGFCTPCGYSGIPRSDRLKLSDFYHAQIDQTQYVLDHFHEIIESKQSGYLNKHRVYKRFPDGPTYKLQLAGESSFFRDAEIPMENRFQILEMFDRFSMQNKVNLHIMLEVRPEHLIKAEASGELDVYRDRGWIKNFTLVVNMGFECFDEVTRNLIYNKNLRLNALEQSVKIAKAYDLDPSLFVFLGGHSLNEAEILADTLKTLDYLQQLNIPPSLMCPNLQPYTINHLLYTYDRYNLADPRTIVKVVEICKDFKIDRQNPSLEVDWFFGGLEAEPAPWLTVFNNPKKITCESCSEILYRSLFELKKNYDLDAFFDSIRPAQNCSCKLQYESFLNRHSKESLLSRIQENLLFAEAKTEDYLLKMNRQER